MSGIVGLVLVVSAMIVFGVTLMVVGRRRELRPSAGDLRTPRDELTRKGKDAIPRVGEVNGHIFGGGAGGGGSR